MTAGPTGAEYAADWSEGGESYDNNLGSSGYSYIRLVYPNFRDYADVPGRWYTSKCRPDAPPVYTVEYQRSHPPRFIPDGDPPPAPEPDVDPEVLVRAARDAMTLPTGTVRWNPSLNGSGATLVNWDTFVWVEGTTTSVTVRAEIPETGTWAQIDAHMPSMTLSADNAEDATCTDAGTPYVRGMKTSSCAIRFYRSSANQPVKDGQTLPTVTLTATANWEATWTSSLDLNPRPLDIPSTTTTAEVPVAEVQTIVTR